MRTRFFTSPTFIRSVSLVVFGMLIVAVVVRASHTSTSIGLNITSGNYTGHDGTFSGALSVTGTSTLTGNVTASGDLAVNGGDITTSATTWNLDVGGGGTVRFRDGTNNLFTIADAGTTGNATVSGTLTVDGASTLTGNVTASGTLAVTGVLTNAADKTDGRIWISPGECLLTGAALWAADRQSFPGGSISLARVTGVDGNQVISCDVTNMVRRTTASKGVKITSFDVMYGISNTALTAHSVALSSSTFVNNTATSVAAFAELTGTLATATQTNPYLTTVTISSAAFHVTDDQKVAIDISFTKGGGGGTTYDFYGILLNVDYNLL